MTAKRMKKLLMGLRVPRDFAEEVRIFRFTDASGRPLTNVEKYRMVKGWLR